jgi:CRISPR-associated endoribonuclease Cas6
MRIKINFTKPTIDIPFNNQSLVNSYIHKCLGINNIYHDAKNDYNISSLIGGRLDLEQKKLLFENGGYIVISSLNAEFINKLLIGIINNQNFICGMVFNGVDHIEEKFYNGWNHFISLSHFIIKEYSDKKNYTFLTLKHENFEIKVKEYLINKISAINPTLDLSDFDVKIPLDYISNEIKPIIVKNVKNIGNKCHLNIFTNTKVAELLYNIGIGQSTGSGFGTIYKTENHKIYRPESKN